MAKLTIDQINCKNKKVLIRCDFNVPLDDSGHITDDRRIHASLQTINKVLNDGGSAILCSHLGRPKGEVKESMRLKPVATRLSELLHQQIVMAPDCIGEQVLSLKKSLEPGRAMLLENLRFHKAETDNDAGFAQKLAEGCDLFINDAFGSAHRAHSSTEGVTKFFKQSAAGYLIGKELKYLGEAIDNPKKPMVAILGGSKISGKIDVIINLMGKVDSLIVGGGMIFTFFKAMGYEVGKSLLEEERLDLAKKILEMAKVSSTKLLLPEDVLAADRFDNDARSQNIQFQRNKKRYDGSGHRTKIH